MRTSGYLSCCNLILILSSPAKPKDVTTEKKKEKATEKLDKGEKPKKKRRQKPRTEEVGGRRIKKETVRMNSRGEEEDADDDNDDDCSAATCLRPTGEMRISCLASLYVFVVCMIIEIFHCHANYVYLKVMEDVGYERGKMILLCQRMIKFTELLNN